MKTRYTSTKKFDNFSVALRQWKAVHSHCQLLHGYAFEIKIWFSSVNEDVSKQLDDMNWIVDFGGFKEKPNGNGLRSWLDHMFDHTLLIEADDPYLPVFMDMHTSRICNLRIVEKMGAESIAKMIYDKLNDTLSKTDAGRSKVIKVELFENNKNSAIYEEY